MEKGIFIAFEGIDRSGKATQSKLLAEHLKEKEQPVVLIHFPQYGKRSAGLIKNYLEGKYGSAEEVGPYRASIFLAVDRYDKSFEIRQYLEQGTTVISDRYWASNVGHQGGKIQDGEERKKFFQWLYHLEFKIFTIPQPDLTLLLKTSPELTQRLVAGQKKGDIHENDIKHERNALRAYLEVAEEFPEQFKIIECVENQQFLSPELIHQRVWKIVESFLLTDKK